MRLKIPNMSKLSFKVSDTLYRRVLLRRLARAHRLVPCVEVRRPVKTRTTQCAWHCSTIAIKRVPLPNSRALFCLFKSQ